MQEIVQIAPRSLMDLEPFRGIMQYCCNYITRCNNNNTEPEEINNDLVLPISDELRHWKYILSSFSAGITDDENVVEVRIDATGTDLLSQVHIRFYVNVVIGAYSLNSQEWVAACDQTELSR